MTASSSSGTLANPVPLRQDARTIGLVGLAHGSSHFFHMLLPPLFPWLIGEFGFSYSELGLLVSVFFVISGVGQALSGFIVDRVGARPVMFFALSSFAAAGLAAGIAQGYWGLLLAAALAGLGNAPFHPVDFTILNKRVSPQRLGHGFSVHGISGNLGWATAPVFMAGIATATGSWRTACLCGGLFALVVLAIMVWNRDALDDRQGAWVHQAKGGAAHVWPAAEHHGHGGHRLHAVRRGGHVDRRLPGGACAAAGEDHLGVPARLGRAAGGGGPGLFARYGGGGGGFGGRAGHGPGGPLARHAHQARRAPRRHGPRVWHGVFGAGPGLLPRRPRVWRHAGPRHDLGHLLRLGLHAGAECGVGGAGGGGGCGTSCQAPGDGGLKDAGAATGTPAALARLSRDRANAF